MPNEELAKTIDSAIEKGTNAAAQAVGQYIELKDSVAREVAELMTDTYTKAGRFVEPGEFMDVSLQFVEDMVRLALIESAKLSAEQRGLVFKEDEFTPPGAKVKFHMLNHPGYKLQEMILRRVRSDAETFLQDKKVPGITRERGPQEHPGFPVISNPVDTRNRPLAAPEVARGEILHGGGTGKKGSREVVVDDYDVIDSNSGQRYPASKKSKTSKAAKRAAKKARHLTGKR